MKLLIVEDEMDLAYFLAKVMTKKNYAVDIACDGEEALHLFDVNQYDAILLDLNLPKIDGLNVLKKIRAQDALINIIILSARSAVEERIKGMDLGANDYLTKPFDFEEVDARLRALFRRVYQTKPEVIAVKGLKLNLNTRRVFFEETELILTPKEYGILEYLMLNCDSIVSGEELVEHVWNSDFDLFSNGLKFHFHSLRKKMAENNADASIIQTIRGKGYLIQREEQK